MVSLFGVELDVPDFGKAAQDAWDSIQNRLRQVTDWLNNWMASFASSLAGYLRAGVAMVPHAIFDGVLNAVKAGINAFKGATA